jgi:hypothetical protein
MIIEILYGNNSWTHYLGILPLICSIILLCRPTLWNNTMMLTLQLDFLPCPSTTLYILVKTWLGRDIADLTWHRFRCKCVSSYAKQFVKILTVTIHDLRIQYTQGSSFAADKRLKENCLSCQTCNLKISPVCKHIQSSRSFFSSWRNYRPGLFGMTRFNSFDAELRAINQASRWIAQGGCCNSILHIQITMLLLVSILKPTLLVQQFRWSVATLLSHDPIKRWYTRFFICSRQRLKGKLFVLPTMWLEDQPSL